MLAMPHVCLSMSIILELKPAYLLYPGVKDSLISSRDIRTRGPPVVAAALSNHERGLLYAVNYDGLMSRLLQRLERGCRFTNLNDNKEKKKIEKKKIIIIIIL